MKISNLILEQGENFGCVMVQFKKDLFKNLQSQISQEDLYNEPGFGVEKLPHCTLLYGLEFSVPITQIKSIVEDMKFNIYELSNISIFENPLYDVLKFKVEAEQIRDINKELQKLPNQNTFPNYLPHSTIGYIKKGQGKKYVQLFSGYTIKTYPESVVYSGKNNTITTLKSFIK